MRQWTVDAFATEPFRGNPACVVEPFDAWPDAGWMGIWGLCSRLTAMPRPAPAG